MLFKDVCNLLERIEPLSSRIEIRSHLKDFLKTVPKDDIDKVIYLFQSEIFRLYEGVELNVGANILEDAVAKAYGFSRFDVEQHHLKSGDLGLSAKSFAEHKKQKALFTKSLTIDNLYKDLRQIAKESGKSSNNSKIKILVALMQNADPVEAKYIVKIILGTLRVSLGIQTIIEAATLLVLEHENINDYKENMLRFNKVKEKIERKYNITNDLGFIIKTIVFDSIIALDKVDVIVGVPIKSALAEREKSPEAIIERLGKCIVEGKYDGFRLQIHHKKGFTKIYSRRSEDLTSMFPEFVNLLQDITVDFILDAEAIGYNKLTDKYMSFQETIKRKRKYNVDETVKEIPIMLHVFDVLYYKDKPTLDLTLVARRSLVEDVVKKINYPYVKATNAIITDSTKELDDFFKSCINSGLEGIIAKDLSKPYVPGLRDFAWIKLKKNYLEGQFDSVDLVVVGYFLGNGKYANLPSSLLCAIYDSDKNVYKAVAKVASGLTEDQINFFAEHFKGIELSEKPKNYMSALEPFKYIKPELIVEVVYDEITKSPLYKDTTDGFSLRFPRFIKVQDDRASDETTSEYELKRLYDLQKK